MATIPAHESGPVLTGRKRWFALLFLALGVAMIILDATVVNVAIPTMVRDLDLTTSDAEWVSAAYSLTFASLLTGLPSWKVSFRCSAVSLADHPFAAQLANACRSRLSHGT